MLTHSLPGYDIFVIWNQPKISSFRLPYQLQSSRVPNLWYMKVFQVVHK